MSKKPVKATPVKKVKKKKAIQKTLKELDDIHKRDNTISGDRDAHRW